MHCHSASQPAQIDPNGSIALVGNPNVGKSVIFQRLTGQQVAIANYPGTTVELARGAARQLPGTLLMDTPGVITFPPHSQDEQVTARVLLYEPLKGLLQVGDAKNLRRTLLLTVQLAELGLPLVLALNMMDEAEARGVILNQPVLVERLAIQVVATTATRGLGLAELTAALGSACPPAFRLAYPAEIEAAIAGLGACWSVGELEETPVAPRALALMALASDQVAEAWLRERLTSAAYEEFLDVRNTLQLSFVEPLQAVIQTTRLEYVDRVAAEVIQAAGLGRQGISARLGRLTTHPAWGTLILLSVLYALYWFVGVFGAGTLVGLLENDLFGNLINPAVVNLVNRVVPYQIVADLLVGEYGLWTMGMTYAFALILPIVATFFLAFGVMEDSGYLPRLAALSNRLFVFLGLNGKAVLPMVLGLGCVTMATLTTRVLESKRERLLVTLLLALAVPCSAQLGVVMGMLAGVSLAATLIWAGVVFAVLLVVGWLSAQLLPGERSLLLVELPPLRLPVFSNVLLKTLARVEWYLKEVVPLFLAGTALLFALDRTGLLQAVIRAGEPLVSGWLGLPPEASAAFLIGFMRRDFGATGLFVMQTQGLLNPQQVVVAMVTITLFIPCIASVMVIARERNWRTALSMVALILPLAFLVGGLLYRGLAWIGWGT
ncbi:MAG TPA: ferrous iron transport protein B [Anaerolineales bacterium]|nr:ferrous iron transport protein B [Anaerolineales bacterium]